jgi:tetratricopeptide (TPR) repeat protein
MGKSRVLYEFRQSLPEKQVTYLEGNCLPYGHTIPYLPVLDIVRARCAIADTDDPEAVTAKVHATLHGVGLHPEADAPYLLQLLGVPVGTERLAMLTPEAIKARTYEILRQLLRRSSRPQPLIVVVEDFHWIDTTSEAFFASLVEGLAGVPILCLATYRPGYRPPWGDRSYATQIALHSLTPQESLTVVHSVRPHEQLSPALVQEILAKAEGNPFFLEELTRAVAEHQDLATHMPVPDTVQGVLMARLDRLPETTKRVLQTAAVLGREVSVRLLNMLWEGPEELAPQLQELQRLEFLYERGGGEEPVYVFKHALTQEVAYDSLLLARRQALHAAAGRALEALYVDRLGEIYASLAYHYARTTEAGKAVEYLTLLAAKAARECAHTEAVTALHEALGHIERLPTEVQERYLPDVGLRLVDSLHYLGRFPESLEVLLRQQARLETGQDAAWARYYYLQLGFTYSMLGDHMRAAQHAQQALTAATQLQDRAAMGRAHYVLALEGYWSGQPQQGVIHGRQAIALLEGTGDQESLGMAHLYLGINQMLLGDFATALEAMVRVRALGEAIGDPNLQSYAAWVSGWLHAMRAEWEQGITLCQQSLARSPHPLNTVLALSMLGYAYLEQGEPGQAIPLLEQAIQHTRQFQHRRLQGWAMILLGEAYRLQGDLEQARHLAGQGLDITQEVAYWPGVGVAQRTLGRIAQASSGLPEATQYLQAALDTFAAMPARYELARTRLDLAALAHAQGHSEAIATHLAEAHTLFTALRIPQYIERTAQLASALGVALRGG